MFRVDAKLASTPASWTVMPTSRATTCGRCPAPELDPRRGSCWCQGRPVRARQYFKGRQDRRRPRRNHGRGRGRRRAARHPRVHSRARYLRHRVLVARMKAGAPPRSPAPHRRRRGGSGTVPRRACARGRRGRGARSRGCQQGFAIAPTSPTPAGAPPSTSRCDPWRRRYRGSNARAAWQGQDRRHVDEATCARVELNFWRTTWRRTPRRMRRRDWAAAAVQHVEAGGESRT